MNVPRYWRTEKTRYGLVGEQCRVCGKHIFPPRDVCPHCTDEGQDVHPFAERATYTPSPRSTTPQQAS